MSRAEIVCVLLTVLGLVAVVVTTLVPTGWPL